jgi:hypothetical protein
MTNRDQPIDLDFDSDTASLVGFHSAGVDEVTNSPSNESDRVESPGHLNSQPVPLENISADQNPVGQASQMSQRTIEPDTTGICANANANAVEPSDVKQDPRSGKNKPDTDVRPRSIAMESIAGNGTGPHEEDEIERARQAVIAAQSAYENAMARTRVKQEHSGATSSKRSRIAIEHDELTQDDKRVKQELSETKPNIHSQGVIDLTFD